MSGFFDIMQYNLHFFGLSAMGTCGMVLFLTASLHAQKFSPGSFVSRVALLMAGYVLVCAGVLFVAGLSVWDEGAKTYTIEGGEHGKVVVTCFHEVNRFKPYLQKSIVLVEDEHGERLDAHYFSGLTCRSVADSIHQRYGASQ